MTTLNWLRSGRSPSGTPARHERPQRRYWFLVVLALAGVSQTGCRCRVGCSALAGRVTDLAAGLPA